MQRFTCRGMLKLGFWPNINYVLVKMQHATQHEPYINIQIPEKWKVFIEEKAKEMTVGQVCIKMTINIYIYCQIADLSAHNHERTDGEKTG
jgi:hypothetical protein